MARKRFITVHLIPDDSSETYTVKLRYGFFEFLFWAILLGLFAMAFAAVRITHLSAKVQLANHMAERNRDLLEKQKRLDQLETELAEVIDQERILRNVLQGFLTKNKPIEGVQALPPYVTNMTNYLDGLHSIDRKIEGGASRRLGEKYPDIWPVTGMLGQKFTSQGNLKHEGIDIIAEENAMVSATARGVVIEAGFDAELGRYVRLDHDFGLQTIYGHLSQAFVKTGDHVGKGMTIGLVGMTGNALGPHLHYEVILRGRQVDPLPYLR